MTTPERSEAPDSPVRATVSGVAAGADPLETTRILRGELGAPHPVPLPRLPKAMPGTTALTRTVVSLPDLTVSLTPHGWRLTGARAGDDAAARRARSQQARVCADTAEVLAGVPAGPTVLDVVGPATLAARLALPSGEPVLADAGARRDLGQAWAQALPELAAAVSASVPGAELVLRVHEPDAADVASGRIRSSSGYRVLPAWDRTLLRSVWEQGVEAAAQREALVWLPLDASTEQLQPQLVTRADALVIEHPGSDPSAWEPVAAWIEAGRSVVVRRAGDTGSVSERARALAGPWRALGLPASALGSLLVDASGEEPADPATLRRSATASRDLADALELVRRDDLAALG